MTLCIWEDCDSDAIYCAGHAREYMEPLQTKHDAVAARLSEAERECMAWLGACGKGDADVRRAVSSILAKLTADSAAAALKGHAGASVFDIPAGSNGDWWIFDETWGALETGRIVDGKCIPEPRPIGRGESFRWELL